MYLGYEKAPLLFEVRGLPRDLATQAEGWNSAGMDEYMGVRIGVVVHCEDGMLRIPSYSSAFAFDSRGEEVRRWEGSRNHFENFIDAVRSRKSTDLTADIEEGHVSSALCHMGNISYTCGVGKGREAALADAAGRRGLDRGLERLFAHLEANGVDPDADQIAVGPWLEMDPETETFLDETANQLISREYRAPFVVPAEV